MLPELNNRKPRSVQALGNELPAGFGLPGGLMRINFLLKAALFGVLLAAAGGCAAVNFSPADDPGPGRAGLERLIARHDYQQALVYLDKIGPAKGGDFYQAQQQRLRLLREAFEIEVEQQAAARAALGEVLEAVTLVDQALEKIPASTKLRKLAETLREERDRRLAAIDRQLLISEAEYLWAQAADYDERARLAQPSFKTRWRRWRMAQSLAALHPGLLNCGQQALQEKNHEVAEKCLRMANKIEESATATELLGQINDLAAEQEPLVLILATKKVKKPAAVPASSALALETALTREMANGELLNAYGILAELEKLPGQGEPVKKYRQQLDRAREGRVATLLEEGSSLYRRGKISEARGMWRQVLQLAPENQIAREMIARADKVLESIQDLQKTQKKAAGSQ